MVISHDYLDTLTYKILGCAIEVHRQLGPGLLESVYEQCLKLELTLRGLSFTNKQKVPIVYKGISLDAHLRYDLLVEDLIIVEVKSIAELLPVHESVLLTYMELLKKPKGILINFNCTHIFKYGQKTLVNKIFGTLPKK